MTIRPPLSRPCGSLALALAVIALSGCAAVNRLAVKSVAKSLSGSGDAFARDDDPELVREAVPFALKTYESLLATVPTYRPLLLATCSNFTQYAYGFLLTDAEVLGEEQHAASEALRQRALKLSLRGRDYCLRGLETRFPGVGERLLRNPETAVAAARRDDVPLLYWTAAAWGTAISLRPDELGVDFPAVRALLERALALDEAWNDGALHETMITIEALGEALGGSEARAREHFARAVALERGSSPGPYVALAAGIALPKQDRSEFVSLLTIALAIDPNQNPSHRLATLLVQRRARALLDRVDSLFLE
jgi:predicted anti-sigma-YlaC factor YlaD